MNRADMRAIRRNTIIEVDYKIVVISNNKQALNSVVIDLKIRLTVNPADPRCCNYYTSTSIHFNGTTTATVYFGGWE